VALGDPPADRQSDAVARVLLARVIAGCGPRIWTVAPASAIAGSRSRSTSTSSESRSTSDVGRPVVPTRECCLRIVDRAQARVALVLGKALQQAGQAPVRISVHRDVRRAIVHLPTRSADGARS